MHSSGCHGIKITFAKVIITHRLWQVLGVFGEKGMEDVKSATLQPPALWVCPQGPSYPPA